MMKYFHKYGKRFSKTASGVFVPLASEVASTSTRTYLQIKDKANEIGQLYTAMKVTLPRDSDLADMLDSACRLSDRWLLGDDAGLSITDLYRSVQLNGIADSILGLKGVTNAKRYLHALASGNLDFAVPKRTRAKDVLWEIEAWGMFRVYGMDAHLIDPPDIIVRQTSGDVWIACKRLYSEKNVEKILSEGIKQIKASSHMRIVAFNLDTLFGQGRRLSARSQLTMAEYLNQINRDFLGRHERHFLKYFRAERLSAVLASISLPVDVSSQNTRPTAARQTFFWIPPKLPSGVEASWQEFRDKFVSRPSPHS